MVIFPCTFSNITLSFISSHMQVWINKGIHLLYDNGLSIVSIQDFFLINKTLFSAFLLFWLNRHSVVYKHDGLKL